MPATPGSPPRTIDEVLRLPRVHYHDRGILPQEPGIYFCLYEIRSVRLAYIGKADDLRARWTGHHRDPELRLLCLLGVAVEIAWLSATKEQLEELERSLIRTFSPPLNATITLRNQREMLSMAARPPLGTTAAILQEYRQRRDNALREILSEDFWEACNSDEGDLLSVWPYPDQVELVDINISCMYSDNHPLTPFRVPYPPAFVANKSGFVVPEPDFKATSIERRDWLVDVGRGVDAFLVAIAHLQAGQLGATATQQVMGLLGKEETITQQLQRTL